LSSQAPLGAQLSDAEILLWQGRFRRAFVGLVGFVGLSLKWTGLINAQSVLAAQIGATGSLVVAVAIVVVYLGANEVLLRRVARERTAPSGLASAVTVADYVLIFSVAYAVTPASAYARSLILAIFIVQFTRLYFGLRATMMSVLVVTVCYTTLVLLATGAGAAISPQEEFWNLAMFLLGAVLLNSLHGTVSGRLDRVVKLFDRAQEGDFGGSYDDSLDRMPDAITVIGRSYNRLRERLETMVLTDPLSGCFNRRGFNQLSAREVSRAIRAQHAIAVLAIDVDHFKRINDEFGHLTGDEVLRDMGARLREIARAGDVVARMGGEEFEILAPDTNAGGATILLASTARTWIDQRAARQPAGT